MSSTLKKAAKSEPMTPLEMVENMRRWLDLTERHLKKKRLYAAYKDFKALKSCAYLASNALSTLTYRAARDWGHFVIRDTKRKTTKVWKFP